MKKYVIGLLAGFLMMGAGAASAKDNPRDMANMWIIEPVDDTPQVATVEKGGLVMKQRLLPTGLATLAEDFSAGGKIIPRGAQLFQVVTDVPVYCVIKRDAARMEKLFAGGVRGQVCLVDADNDQQFEGYFPSLSFVKALPMINGRRPSNAKPAEPVPYIKGDPRAVEKPFWVGVTYLGKPLVSDDRAFEVTFGSDTESDFISQNILVPGAVFPVSQQVLGATFTLLGVDDGKIRVRVDRTMPAQLFGVMKQ